KKMRETFQEVESTQKIRILLVDDHTMFRAGIRVLFERYRDMQIVGECCGGQEAVRLTRELKPDILLLDLLLKEGSGMDVLRELREPEAPTKTIMLRLASKEIRSWKQSNSAHGELCSKN